MSPDLFGSPAGPSVPLSPAGGSAPASDTFAAALLGGGDAQAVLVNGVLAHQLQLSTPATQAASFLYTYDCGDVADRILYLRQFHQSPKKLMEALEAASLKKFMDAVSVNLSNGK